MPNVTSDLSQVQQRTLDDLADSPRWVAWRKENRKRKDGTTFTTKIPYDPNSKKQACIPTDPSTWSTRKRAQMDFT
jgi:hypothetical protein